MAATVTYMGTASQLFLGVSISFGAVSPNSRRVFHQVLLQPTSSKRINEHPSERAFGISAALGGNLSRRGAISLSGAKLCTFLLFSGFRPAEGVSAAEYTDMPALRGKDYGKSKMSYPDYVQTDSGLQYKDLREGDGLNPREGDQVVVDWAGYTIGYYGRIFEARNKAKGGSFEGNDKDYFKFKLGSDQVIPAFEEAVKTMRVGGVRRIIVPSDLGYPNNDYNARGPKPATFSGQRALDFVLKNEGLIDKTLLFDIELMKVVQK